jgi:hypothetical protein
MTAKAPYEFESIEVVSDQGERTVAIDGRPLDLDIANVLAQAFQARQLRRIATALERIAEKR